MKMETPARNTRGAVALANSLPQFTAPAETASLDASDTYKGFQQVAPVEDNPLRVHFRIPGDRHRSGSITEVLRTLNERQDRHEIGQWLAEFETSTQQFANSINSLCLALMEEGRRLEVVGQVIDENTNCLPNITERAEAGRKHRDARLERRTQLLKGYTPRKDEMAGQKLEPWTTEEWLDGVIIPYIGDTTAVVDSILASRRKKHSTDWTPYDLLQRASFNMLLRLAGLQGGQNQTPYPTPADIQQAVNNTERYQDLGYEDQPRINAAILRHQLVKVGGLYWKDGRTPPNYFNFIETQGKPGVPVTPLTDHQQKRLQGPYAGMAPNTARKRKREPAKQEVKQIEDVQKEQPQRKTEVEPNPSSGQGQRSSEQAAEQAVEQAAEQAAEQVAVQAAEPAVEQAAGQTVHTFGTPIPHTTFNPAPPPEILTPGNAVRQKGKKIQHMDDREFEEYMSWEFTEDYIPPDDPRLKDPQDYHEWSNTQRAQYDRRKHRQSIKENEKLRNEKLLLPQSTPMEKQPKLEASFVHRSRRGRALSEPDHDTMKRLRPVPTPEGESPTDRDLPTNPNEPGRELGAVGRQLAFGKHEILKSPALRSPPPVEAPDVPNPIQNPTEVEDFCWHMIKEWQKSLKPGGQLPPLEQREVDFAGKVGGYGPIVDGYMKIVRSIPLGQYAIHHQVGFAAHLRTLELQRLESERATSEIRNTLAKIDTAIDEFSKKYGDKEMPVRGGNKYNGGTTIGYKSIKTFFISAKKARNNGWLDTTALEAGLAAAQRGPTSEKFNVIHNEAWQECMTATKEEMRLPKYWSRHMTAHRYIVCHQDKHWFALSIDVEKREVCVMDSRIRRTEEDKHVTCIMALLRQFYPKGKDWQWKLVEDPSPRQKNQYDCGMFVIQNFKALVNGESAGTVNVDGQTREETVRAIMTSIETDSEKTWDRVTEGALHGSVSFVSGMAEWTKRPKMTGTRQASPRAQNPLSSNAQGEKDSKQTQENAAELGEASAKKEKTPT
jgi:hypothetical protein